MGQYSGAEMARPLSIFSLALFGVLFLSLSVFVRPMQVITSPQEEPIVFEGEPTIINGPGCESCRTLIEQFYKGWEKTIMKQAHEGKSENQQDGAPKITYNQDIEDYLQGFCKSDYMKPFAPYIKEGCERIMKVHHRKIVGLFLHGEEQYGKAGVKSNRPERVGKVCTEMVKACPALPVKQLAVASDKDTCGACKSVVADALFLLKRDNIFASLAPKAFKKRTLELFDLLEPMCMDTYHRHADFPELHYAVCQEMWEEDDEGLMRALAAGGAGAARADAQRAVCAETFKYCKAGEISGEEEGGEL